MNERIEHELRAMIELQKTAVELRTDALIVRETARAHVEMMQVLRRELRASVDRRLRRD